MKKGQEVFAIEGTYNPRIIVFTIIDMDCSKIYVRGWDSLKGEQILRSFKEHEVFEKEINVYEALIEKTNKLIENHQKVIYLAKDAIRYIKKLNKKKKK